MAENRTVKSRREQFSERLKNKYPERDFEDDEALFGQISDDYDAHDKDLEEYKAREKAMGDLFASDPRSATFLANWRNGGDPAVELVRQYGDDFMEALSDPDKQEALAQASKDFAERVAKEKDFDEQYEKNIGETLDLLSSIQEEQGWDDDQVDAVMEFLVGIMKDGILGKFSRESILMASKALNHDADVDEASVEGEIRGRNAKIEEKLRKGAKTDGTANLGSKNGGGGANRELPNLGALNRYDNQKSIWERGGEKRTVYK